MVMFCIVSFSATWWVVYFWDCQVQIGEAYYYIYLDTGICYSSDQNKSGDFEQCRNWNKVDGSIFEKDPRKAAALYQASDACCIAATVLALGFVIFALVLMFEPNFRYGRNIQVGLTAAIALLLAASLAISTDTDFIRPDMYLNDAYCRSTYSFPQTGYFSSAIGALLAVVVGLVVLFPFGICIKLEIEGRPLSRRQRNSLNDNNL